MSIAGGYFRALESGRAVGCDCVQIFTKNNNQWKAKPITDDDIRLFKNALRESNIVHPLSHSSYLINVASPDPELRKKSIDAMIVELQRADQLGVPYVVLHPGSFTTSSETVGLQTVATSLDEVCRQTKDLTAHILLENTAGQGSNLGWRFEHLSEIRTLSHFPERLAVCLDTCHTIAAGYPISEPKDFDKTISEFDRIVGLDLLKAIHLNDSRTPLGSRRDRHEHIGRGAIGDSGFRNLLNDPRFEHIPMYLETEKGTENGEDLDAMNLRILRALIGSPKGHKKSSPQQKPKSKVSRTKQSATVPKINRRSR